MFILYSRNTVIRAYFDKYVDKKAGATLKEVATGLGYSTKNISDAVFSRGSTVVEYIRLGPGRYYSTDEHNEGWDPVAAEGVLEDHLSGRHRVEGIEAKTKVEAQLEVQQQQRPYRSRRVARPGAEDWSHLHFWEAVLRALEELVAIHRGGARAVEDIKAKLVEHKVTNLDRLGPTLRLVAYRLGWVADIGGDPGRWYLTPEYNRLTVEERAIVLAQWDDQGNPLDRGPVEPVPSPVQGPVEPTYDEGHVIQPEEGRVLAVQRFNWSGSPFGTTPDAKVVIEAYLPKEVSAQERLGLFRFIMKVREDLLDLI